MCSLSFYKLFFLGTLSGSCCPQTIKTSSRIQIQVRIQEIGLLKKGTYIDMVKSYTNFQIATAISSEWVCEGGSVWGEGRGSKAAECRRASNALKFNMKTLSMQMNVATCLCLWTVAASASASAASPKKRYWLQPSRAKIRYDAIPSDPICSHSIRFNGRSINCYTVTVKCAPVCVCLWIILVGKTWERSCMQITFSRFGAHTHTHTVQ